MFTLTKSLKLKLLMTLAKMLRFPAGICERTFGEFLSAVELRLVPFFFCQSVLGLFLLCVLCKDAVGSLHVEQFEGVFQQLLLDFFVHRAVCMEAWSVVHLYHLGSETQQIFSR